MSAAPGAGGQPPSQSSGDTGPKPAQAARSVGIDLARGLAVVLMIQTHAFDGWASPAAKKGWGYALSRVFANIPAPLFLLLAGVGLAFGFQGAMRRGASANAARVSLAWRAAQLVGYGYLVNLIYALIDWQWVPGALLRADILHCIGLSLILGTLLLVGRSGVALRAAGIAAVALAAGIVAGRLPAPHGWLRVPLALVVDVPPFTRFPLLPLVGFTALGVAVGVRLQRQLPTLRQSMIGFVLLVALVPLWQHLTAATLASLGGKLSRSHPAVVWNFLEGCTRALAVVLGSLALASLLERRQATQHGAVTWLLRLGRGSLLAYAVHIPLCYGRLARPIAQRLAMPRATVLVVALIASTYLVVRLRDQLRDKLKERSR